MNIQKEKNIISEFEALVKEGLLLCGINEDSFLKIRIGAAVSGGADSISLLTSLSHILKNVDVITINHNLRPKEETSGDADYVESYCKKINVSCTRIEIPRGKIISLSKERGMGVEEAARFFRYDYFEKFIDEKKLDFLCLAHNQNDQVETVVMRFLRGSGTESLYGIPLTRGKIIRPLLNIPRKEIEAYLAEQGIEYRTDKTNFDSSITRNLIRNELVPLLDSKMEGWKKSVLSLSRKAYDDEESLKYLVNIAKEKVSWNVKKNSDKEKTVSMKEKEFVVLFNSVKRRLVYNAVDEVGAEERIPYSFVEGICGILKNKNDFKKSAAGIEVFTEDGVIYIHKKTTQATESGYFAIINSCGEYKIGPWIITARENQNKEIDLFAEGCNVEKKILRLENLKFPFAIRSREPCDEIEDSNHSMRSVSKILAGCRNIDDVPLVQEMNSSQKIICIWKSLAGSKDWIVKN